MLSILVVVALMALGVTLVAIEIFVLPGTMLVGVLGGIGILSSIWAAYDQFGMSQAGVVVLGSVAVVGGVFGFLRKNQLVRGMLRRETDTAAVADASLASLVGCEGVTVTTLRPSGSIDIDGRVLDAISAGEYLPRDVAVRVAVVRGGRVWVEAVR